MIIKVFILYHKRKVVVGKVMYIRNIYIWCNSDFIRSTHIAHIKGIPCIISSVLCIPTTDMKFYVVLFIIIYLLSCNIQALQGEYDIIVFKFFRVPYIKSKNETLFCPSVYLSRPFISRSCWVIKPKWISNI